MIIPFHYYVIAGNLPFLEECLANRVSPNGLDKSGSTALHWAASAGHIGKEEKEEEREKVLLYLYMYVQYIVPVNAI